MVWSITCVDTMKDSRDTSAPAQQLSAAVIAQGVNLCAGLNVTHITCDVFFDYPDYMALWVAAIRATGKNVWFRPHWNAWEGNNGVSATMTPAQYLTATVAFIQANPTLFASGDIFDMCSEADNSPYWVSTYGANYTNGAPNTATDAFNQFHLDLKSQCDAALIGQNIVGVITGIHTLNSFWAKTIAALYPATVRTLGYVAMDSYPEASSTSPSVCAAARLAELQTVANARPGVNIVIGELGYSNSVTVDDATQQSVLAAEFAAIATIPAIVGMNYWAAQGTETSGGHTHLFAGVRGAWSYRPAALTLRDFYFQQLNGGQSATLTLNAGTINIMSDGTHLFVDAGTLVLDQAIGQRSTADFVVIDEAGTHHYEQGMPLTVVDDATSARIFGGVVSDVKEEQPNHTGLLRHTLAFVDNHYYADKRRIVYSNVSVAAGSIVQDIVTNVLASEGVTVQRGVNKYSAQQSNVEQNDMSGFSQGTSVTISQDTTPGNAWQGTDSLKVITSGGTHTFEQIEVHVDATQFTPGASVTISAYVKASTGTPVLRWFLQSNTGAIGGTTTVTLSTTWQRITRTVTLPNPMTGIVYIGMRLDTGSPAQAITFFLDGMQIEQAAAVSAWELGGLQQSVQPGPIISEFTSNYETCAACMDALAQAANFFWQIDQNKVLWFVAPGTLAAPWDAVIPGRDIVRDNVTLERTNPQYRNRQYVLGGTDQTTTQVETRRGDGNTQVFTMSYAVSTVPTITVNGVAQTVGIGGVDTGKQWYWNGGKNEIFQDSGGTKLNAVYQSLIATGATSGTFTLSYKGVATANINWNDTAATVQTRLQALSTVGAGNALVTGGPLPGTSLLITFAAALAQDQTQVVVGTNALVGGTPTLASVAPLSVTYIGEFPVVVLSSNDAEVTAQLAREGGAGTGYVEDVVVDSTLKTRGGAFQSAAGYISRYAQLGRRLTFKTLRGGLQQGQLLTVTIPAFALSNAQMLIESVHVTHDGLRFWYEVAALLGPINSTWVQFFQGLAAQSKATVDAINLGSGSTLTLLQSFTATATKSATFTATVYACPICNTTTLCGTGVLVC